MKEIGNSHMQDKISVVVPIYNVDKYLKICVESIMKQTYKNMEIILVDDGSTDQSSQICDLLKTYDSRIVVIHKKNGGLSDARNCGIDIATGKYISFIDSDDWINSIFIENLYNNIIKYNSQIAVGNIYEVWEKENKIKFRVFDNDLVLNKDEAIRKLITQEEIVTAAWNKLYYAELFKDIRFPKGKLYEDLFVMYRLFDKANKISIAAHADYYYRIRSGSIINTKFNEKRFDMIEAQEERIEFLSAKFPNYVNIAKMCLYETAVNLYIEAKNTHCKEKKLFKTLKVKLKDNREAFINCKEYIIKKKIKILVRLYFYPLARYGKRTRKFRKKIG